jgi:gas vesicle protein
MSSEKLLLSVLAGVAAGAMLGILFAPDKGWNTRKRIAKKGEDYTNALSENFREFFINISEEIYEVKDEVTDFSVSAPSQTA